MYDYIVTIEWAGTLKEVTISAKNPSQAMANVVSEYPGALIVRVV